MKTIKTILAAIILGIAIPTAMQAQSFLTNGLVAFYPFNGNANDASGNGNNGSFVGSDRKFLADRFGLTNSLWLNTTSAPAWNLDGAYVSGPRSAALNFDNNFTLSLWVNFTNDTPIPNGVFDQGYAHNLISNGGDANSVNVRIITDAIHYGGQDYYQFAGSGVNIFALLPPLRHTWRQLTVVRSGTNLNLFKNGIFLTNGIVGPMGNNPTIWIGRHDEGGGNGSYYPLVGGMDDVRMYNRALSASEVGQLYDYESGPRVSLLKAVKPSFSNLTVNTNYQLQVSGNLNTWTNQGSAFIATNINMIYPQYFDVDNWSQLYFRLQVP